jgi:methyl-accepting chemotaxis protein
MVLTEAKARATRLQTAVDDYAEAFEGFRKASSTADQETQSGVMVGAAKELSQELAALRKQQLGVLDDIRASSLWWSTIALMLAVAGAIFSGVMLTRAITKPIAGVSKFAQQLAAGDLRARMAHDAEDEFGAISSALNDAMASLRSMMSNIGAAATQLSSSIVTIGENITTSVTSIDRQHSQTELVATAVTEMASATGEIAQNATITSQQSDNANRLVRAGQQDVRAAVDAMRKLRTDMENTASLVERLTQDNKKINDILTVIRGIAEQTNLLALNAASEAARAGEQGRGFAVVADEVRQLAQRTQGSISEITQIIESITHGTRDVVQVIEASKSETTAVSDKTQHLNEFFGEFTSSMNVINDMNAQISVGVEEQSTVAQDLSENLVRIKQLADTSKAGLKQIHQQSGEQAQLVKHLEQVIASFKV